MSSPVSSLNDNNVIKTDKTKLSTKQPVVTEDE